MRKGPNPFKLGLFIVAAIAAAAGTSVALGARAVQKDTVVYHTYFNESVQGLDIGAPVKYRGVTIGMVSEIQIAPDQRHVDVSEELLVSEIRRMGLVEKIEGETKFIVPADLRAQLGSQGITGVKFVLIDFFDPGGNPVPELPFAPAHRYIPAAASLMKNLEETAQKTFDRLPEIAERLASTLAHVEQMLEEINQKNIPDHLVAAINEATETLKDVRKVVRSVDRQELPARAATLIARVDKAADEVIQVLEGVSSRNGVLASVQRTSEAALELGKAATGRVNDLERTLRELGDASQAIRDLAEMLQRHPDMLVKGRPAVGEK